MPPDVAPHQPVRPRLFALGGRKEPQQRLRNDTERRQRSGAVETVARLDEHGPRNVRPEHVEGPGRLELDFLGRFGRYTGAGKSLERQHGKAVGLLARCAAGRPQAQRGMRRARGRCDQRRQPGCAQELELRPIAKQKGLVDRQAFDQRQPVGMGSVEPLEPGDPPPELGQFDGRQNAAKPGLDRLADPEPGMRLDAGEQARDQRRPGVVRLALAARTRRVFTPALGGERFAMVLHRERQFVERFLEVIHGDALARPSARELLEFVDLDPGALGQPRQVEHRGRDLLRRGRIGLADARELADILVDAGNGRLLFLHRRRDRADQLVGLGDAAGDLLHLAADLACQRHALLGLRGRLAHLLGDILGEAARAASIEALSESMLVWLAMREIASAIRLICVLFSEIAPTSSTMLVICLISLSTRLAALRARSLACWVPRATSEIACVLCSRAPEDCFSALSWMFEPSDTWLTAELAWLAASA